MFFCILSSVSQFKIAGGIRSVYVRLLGTLVPPHGIKHFARLSFWAQLRWFAAVMRS
jgi:hypothetical protein